MGYSRNYGRNKNNSASNQTPSQEYGASAYGAGHPAPQASPTPPAPPSQETNHNDNQFVSTKIWKVHGKDKVIDFSSKLTKALPEDFANIHGIGGSDHAPNSTICATICDSTKGTGDKSVTVKYCIDVEDIPMLYNAAMAARLGQLTASQPANTATLQSACETVRNQLRNWLKIAPYPDNSRPIPQEEITLAGKTLSDALSALESNTATSTVFSYTRQKNNPYATVKMNGASYAPVSQIAISCDPSRRYPWTIQISNFDAPIKQRNNGATTHNARDAINKKEAFINLSMDDFCASLVAIERFIKLWEQRMYKAVDAGCTQYELLINGLREKKQAG